jgi:hypothetical protein
MKNKTIHVMWDEIDQNWLVKRAGRKKPLARARREKQASKLARVIARKHSAPVVIHRQNGNITEVVSGQGPKRYGKYRYNLEAFTNEDAISYYLLGAFISDGNVSLSNNRWRSAITSNDREWMVAIQKIACPDMPVSIKQKTVYGNHYQVRMNCHDMGLWLIAHGCVPRKSLILRMPIVPKKFLPDFIRGCFDGDGSIDFRRTPAITTGNATKQWYRTVRRATLTSGSRLFLEGMRNSLQSLGIASRVYTRHTKGYTLKTGAFVRAGTSYILSIENKTNILKFCKLVYLSNNLIALERKREKARQIVDNIVNGTLAPIYKNRKPIRNPFRNATRIPFLTE